MAQDIIIAGASGLVGSEIVRQVIAQAESRQIFALGRRAPEVTSTGLHFVPWDFSSPIKWGSQKPQKPVAICTLGTTIKVAGSQEAFRKVDYDFVVRFAEEALALGATSLHVVTAHGVSPTSPIFYNRVKGEVEIKLQALGLPALHIYRPSLLIGERTEKRAGEGVATVVAKFLNPIFSLPVLKNIQPTPADTLARYMLKTAMAASVGNHLHTNLDIMTK